MASREGTGPGAGAFHTSSYRDEIPYSDLWPKFVASMGMTVEEAEARGVGEMFQWAFEGNEHIDQIWRPLTAEDDN